MIRRFAPLAMSALCAVAGVASAQSAAEHLARGNTAYAARGVPEALAHYDSALAADPKLYEALWRAAQAEVDLAEYDPDPLPIHSAQLLQRAAEHARAAIGVEPKRVEGHFALARALGRATDHTDNPTDRVQFGVEAHREALACLAIDPKHGGCLHVLGLWNARVAELDDFSRGWANRLSGGTLFDQGSWAEAERCLEAAAANDPRRLVHHLDLARVYARMGKKELARKQFEAVLQGAALDYNDPHYKDEARAALTAQ